MKTIRVTFKNEDFASVSQSLIDLGVVFQVEPVDADDSATVRAERSVAVAPRPVKKPVKKSGKTTPGVSGAAALRAIAERNRVGGDGTSSGTTGIPEDLSEKLMPYGDRPASDQG